MATNARKSARDLVVKKYTWYSDSCDSGPICCKGNNTRPCYACGRFICMMSGCRETYDHAECSKYFVSLCRECGPQFIAELEDADRTERTNNHEHAPGILTAYNDRCEKQFIRCCVPGCDLFGQIIDEDDYDMFTLAHADDDEDYWGSLLSGRQSKPDEPADKP